METPENEYARLRREYKLFVRPELNPPTTYHFANVSEPEPKIFIHPQLEKWFDDKIKSQQDRIRQLEEDLAELRGWWLEECGPLPFPITEEQHKIINRSKRNRGPISRHFDH